MNSAEQPFKPGDTFDSRDVIDRIAYLSDMRDNYGDDFLSEDAEGLAKLEAFADEAESYVSDWKYGEVFISDDYFEDYARELAEDIGAIDRNAEWPLQYVDWEAAADALKQDYTEIEFDGVTYWAR
jgi:hypothetical protein